MLSKYPVIIVGAGPVGLLTAIKLGRQNIRTLVVEKHGTILEAARAIAYLPTVIGELKKLGIYEEIEKAAFKNYYGPSWRKLDGTELAAVGLYTQSVSSESPFILMLGQDSLTRILLGYLAKCESVTVEFGAQCMGIEQSDSSAKIMVHHLGEDRILEAEWLVGADGANSSVRRCACIQFEGFSWSNFRFTAADVRYDFEKEGGYRAGNFIVDPNDWAVIARTGPEGVWRLAYGESLDLPADEASVLERSRTRIPRFLPGSKEYELVRLKPYIAQQRCAAEFKKGRVLLVGDAAHSNNPVGGLGLTGGILDACVLGNALVRCISGGEPEDLLERAMRSRRETWLTCTNPTSSDNFLRLCSEDAAISRQRDEFFHGLKTDPSLSGAVLKSLEEALLPDTFESNRGVSPRPWS